MRDDIPMTNELIPAIDDAHPIAPRMLDALDAYDAFQNEHSIAIRSCLLDLTDYTLTIARCDAFDDCAILNLDLDDELPELTLIAIFDRESLTMRRLILHCDTDILDNILP